MLTVTLLQDGALALAVLFAYTMLGVVVWSANARAFGYFGIAEAFEEDESTLCVFGMLWPFGLLVDVFLLTLLGAVVLSRFIRGKA